MNIRKIFNKIYRKARYKLTGTYPFPLYRPEIREIIKEYDETVTFVTEYPAGLTFTPGQFVHLKADLGPIEKPMVRHMSIASVPADGELRFSIDLKSQSPFKQKLSILKPGDYLEFFKIGGRFTFTEIANDAPVIFIAGGIGITPIRSLIRSIADGRRPWGLMHVGRSHLYEAETRNITSAFGIHYTGRSGIQETLDGYFTRLKDASIETSIPYWFISGSEDFVDSLADELKSRGISEDQIRRENFNH